MFDVTAEGRSGGPPAAPGPRERPRRIDAGTGQQEALWDALVSGTSHALVTARAGSGKSASCREGMHRVLEARPGLRVRYAVYNKTAADEFRPSCPPGADVGTVHSFGFAALRRAFDSRVEKNKTYLVLDDDPRGRNLPRYMRKSVAMLASAAKNQGMPPRHGNKGAAAFLLRLLDLLEHYDINDYGRPDVIAEHADRVLTKSAEWTQVVDFDDMVWLPGVHGCEFPPCDLLFLDEVQDWNPAQHALIPLLCRSGRVAAVGDPCQAIYVWRGADPESMPRLGAYLAGRAAGLAEFPLSITFRCPHSHVRLAQRYVPDITAHPPNREGTISYLPDADAVLDAVPGDLVICPKNAPVIRAALKLIAQRRRAVVKGRAVGDQLLSVLRSCGECRTMAELGRAVEKWRGRELARLAELDGVEDVVESVGDRADGLQAVLSFCAQPSEVEPAVAELFSEDFRDDAVNFSTVHRAKGAEADNVWLIEAPGRPPRREWEEEQARNLAYVSLTRAKDTLRIITHPE